MWRHLWHRGSPHSRRSHPPDCLCWCRRCQIRDRHHPFCEESKLRHRDKESSLYLHPSMHTAFSQIFNPEQSESVLHPQVWVSPPKSPLPRRLAPAPHTGRSAGQLASEAQPNNEQIKCVQMLIPHPSCTPDRHTRSSCHSWGCYIGRHVQYSPVWRCSRTC